MTRAIRSVRGFGLTTAAIISAAALQFLLSHISITEAFTPMRRRSGRIRHVLVDESSITATTRTNSYQTGGSPTSLGSTSTMFLADAGTFLQTFQWEDVVYRAESVASNLAQVSLQDPGNLVTALPVMYGAGLLTSFSPCVWGLLPLTMSYISSAAGERSDGQTILPTAAFAGGLAVVFCSLGVAAVELGGVLGVNNASVAIVSNVICLAMGLKLLDLVNLPLPSFDFVSQLKNKDTEKDGPILLDATGRQVNSKASSEAKGGGESGSLLRTFLLGGSSALVASPCATPVLTSILAFVANASNPALGALLLLGYTLGYSTPLLLVAGTGGQALVKLKSKSSSGDNWYSAVAPWVTPLTGGILLWYGTNGMLTTVFGDPSLAGLAILE